jgi:toxin ParE1/3/4
MKVIVREAAEEDIDSLFAYIAKDNPAAAAKVVAQIRRQINRLETDSLVEMGRDGLVEGTREMTVHPYIIVYQIVDDPPELHVLSVVHGAQDR